MTPPRAIDLGLAECHGCGALAQATLAACPRCRATLHQRKPASIARTWAYLFAALILYIPANVLPVMYTSMFGQGSESTILGGVVDFWHEGAWDIAAIIFVASVAVPCVKFFVLGLLLVTVQRGSGWASRQRAAMYRMVETIGYWSMLDVVVVAIVCALVQFGTFGVAEPRPGIVFFGLTVVLTMFAAMSFDPRLIWDVKTNDA